MKYSLLELVQQILNSLDSDEVNSITDTTEALDVANIVKECYWDIIGEIDPKETQGLFHLDSSGDNLKPTLMTLPNNVSEIKWLKYNVGDTVLDSNFRDLFYLDLEDFFQRFNGLDVNENWVASQTISISGQDFEFKFRNDEYPSYWTSIDDTTILLDSVDLSVENTLTSSRTLGYGSLIPQFQMLDTFVPKLDARQFQLLLQSAKAQAFIEKKQMVNEKAEKKERKNRILAYKAKNPDRTDTRSPLQRHNRKKGFGR